MRKTTQPFRPRAKLLLELGNQLIRDEGIALFELAKNSYDADSTEVKISLRNIDSTEKGEITIFDDGTGMDWDTITGVWLEPGTDYRQKQFEKNKKTAKFHRLPLGQKGIGRFGAHKLGKRVQLITRSMGNNEIVVNVNWSDFESSKYLEDIPINVVERKPELFTGKKSGTRIYITDIWQPWNRGMVRSVYRAVNSICSPFKSPDSFRVIFNLEDKDKHNWLEGLLKWQEALEYTLFKASCTLKNDDLEYIYEFVPWKAITKVSGRKRDISKENTEPIKMIDDNTKEQIKLNNHNIGTVIIDLYMFDLDTNILALGVPDKRGLKDFLRFNGGIRVHRDGVRVYDYGEPGNDWLDLGGRRVNVPSQRLSNNLVIGSVRLNRSTSSDLIEKTNREGFIENPAVRTFRKAVIFAVTQIEAERSKDKERLRIAYGKTIHREPVLDDIIEIRNKIAKNKKLKDEIEGYLDRIEKDFKDILDRLLTSAGAGLSLSIVIHEIEKILNELKTVVNRQKGITRIKTLTKHLADLIEGYAALVRREGTIKLKARDLIEQALFNVDYRLKVHNIELINRANKRNDFVLKGTRRLLLGAIMNIIDNSIWWLANKKPKKKYIYITTTNDLKDGPSIIIGDNGPGFIDDLEFIVQPFFTRKPEGMGLGLHIANEIMKIHKGKLKIIDKGDVSIPNEINGAVLALIFNRDNV